MPVHARRNYPTALPHRSPEEIAAAQEELRRGAEKLSVQAARLRRLTAVLLTGTGLALLAAAAVVWLSLHRRNAGAEAAPALPAPASSALASFAASPPTKVVDAVEAKSSASSAAKTDPAPKEPTPATDKLKPLEPATVAPATISAEKDLFLEALGGLSATHLYQNYLLVGLLADGVESKAISVEGATNTLKIVTDCLSLVDAKLAKLGTTPLDAEDLDSLQHIKAVAGLLRIQAQALRSYWSTGEMEQSQQYQQARRAAWTGLSKVLGLDK